jgi:hypothetical protein
MINNILFVVIVEKGDVVAKPEMGKRRVSVHVKFKICTGQEIKMSAVETR